MEENRHEAVAACLFVVPLRLFLCSGVGRQAA